MPFDPAVSLRIINNQRLMRATHRGEYRDLGGALAITSDVALAPFNCIEGFTTDARRIDGLLDIGFSLLRAFDRAPAARLTPLDRPTSVEEHLRRRGLTPATHDVSLVHRGDWPVVAPPGGVTVRRAEPEDAGDVATVQSLAFRSSKWMRPFLLGAALANIIEPGHAFHVAYAAGEAAGAALSISEDGVTGIYSVAVLRAHRRTGIASALVAKAIADIEPGTLVCAEVERDSDGHRLFEKLGFEAAHEAALWTPA